MLETPENKFAMGFSPDGRYLLYRNTGPNTDWDLWALPLGGDRKPFPVAKTPFQEMMGEFSPDSHWIAFQSNESGRTKFTCSRSQRRERACRFRPAADRSRAGGATAKSCSTSRSTAG